MKRTDMPVMQDPSGKSGFLRRAADPGVLVCLLAVSAWFFAGASFAVGKGGPVVVQSADGYRPDEETGPEMLSGDFKGRVLVAYETRKGSTKELAETVASGIRSEGWDVRTADIKDSPRPEEYDHVILGGPIYFGKIKELKNFVKRHEEALRCRLAGAFAVGMSFAVQDEEKRASGQRALEEAIAPLEVAKQGLFPGKIDLESLSFLEKAMVKMVKSPVGDFRDLKGAEIWAREVARDLQYSK